MRAYRLITKIKNNRLWESIVEAYPEVRNQAHAAKVLKVHQSLLGNLLNMKLWPHHPTRGWRPVARHLAALLGQSPEFLFDPALYGMPPLVNEVHLTVDRPMLPDTVLLMLPEPEPDERLERRERTAAIFSALDQLTPREAEVVKLRFGLDGQNEHTYDEIGARYALTHVRVRQIEQKALRKLRHPSRELRKRAFF